MNKRKPLMTDHEINTEIYGEEIADAHVNLKKAMLGAMDKIEKVNMYLRVNKENKVSWETMLGNLMSYIKKNHNDFSRVVKAEIKKYGAIGISDLYMLHPANKGVGLQLKAQEKELIIETAKLGLEVTHMTTEASYHLQKGRLDHANNLIDGITNWIPKYWTKFLDWEAEEKAKSAKEKDESLAGMTVENMSEGETVE